MKREGGQVAVWDVEVAIFVHEGGVLLSVVGDARRERRDVPMDVGVALLAAQSEDIEALGRDCSAYGSAEPMHST